MASTDSTCSIAIQRLAGVGKCYRCETRTHLTLRQGSKPKENEPKEKDGKTMQTTCTKTCKHCVILRGLARCGCPGAFIWR